MALYQARKISQEKYIYIYLYIFFNDGQHIIMSAKKLIDIESITIAAFLVLLIAMLVNLSEYIYQLT